VKSFISLACVALAGAIACHASAPATPASAAAPAATPSGVPRDILVRTSVRAGETFIPRTGDDAIRAFVPDVSGEQSGGECSFVRTGGSGATVATAYYPSRLMAQLQVSVTFDSAGRLVRYSERRGVVRFAPTPGMTPARIDSLIRATEAKVRSTSISIDYAIDQAVVSNRGRRKVDGSSARERARHRAPRQTWTSRREDGANAEALRCLGLVAMMRIGPGWGSLVRRSPR